MGGALPPARKLAIESLTFDRPLATGPFCDCLLKGIGDKRRLGAQEKKAAREAQRGEQKRKSKEGEKRGGREPGIFPSARVVRDVLFLIFWLFLSLGGSFFFLFFLIFFSGRKRERKTRFITFFPSLTLNTLLTPLSSSSFSSPNPDPLHRLPHLRHSLLQPDPCPRRHPLPRRGRRRRREKARRAVVAARKPRQLVERASSQ